MFFIFLFSQLELSPNACAGRQEAAGEKFLRSEDFEIYLNFDDSNVQTRNLLAGSNYTQTIRIANFYPRKHHRFFRNLYYSQKMTNFGPRFKSQGLYRETNSPFKIHVQSTKKTEDKNLIISNFRKSDHNSRFFGNANVRRIQKIKTKRK